MPTYQFFPKWPGKTPKTKKISVFQPLFEPFWAFLVFLPPFAERKEAIVWCYGLYRYWCPLTVGAAVHI